MFRAERIEDKTVLAVLILHENQFNTSEAFTRLENDVTALQNLRQPAFQRIYSLERANTSSFLTLEWLQGSTLLDLLRTRRALPVGEAVALLQPPGRRLRRTRRRPVELPRHCRARSVASGVDVAKPLPGGVMPRFLPLAISGSARFPPIATMVATPFAMMKQTGAFAGNPSSAYIFSVAILAYEMLGGMRGGSSAGGYVPISGLSGARKRRPAPGHESLAGIPTPRQSSSRSLAAANPASSTASVAGSARSQPLRHRCRKAVGSGALLAPAPPPMPPTAAPPEKKKSPAASFSPLWAVVVLLVGGLVIWQGVAFVQRMGANKTPVENPDAPTDSPTPASTPIVKATPTPPPEPKVDPQKKDYDDMMAPGQSASDEG